MYKVLARCLVYADQRDLYKWWKRKHRTFLFPFFLIFNNPYADVREFQRDVVHQKALNYNCSDCYPKIGGKLEVGGAAVYYWDAAQISASNKLTTFLSKNCVQ